MKIEKYQYLGYRNAESFCDIEIIENTKVILIERNDNPGTSITNMVDYLANKLCEEYSIDKHRLVLIEKYQYPKEEARYSLVKFDLINNKFNNPRWTHLNDCILNRLIKN